VRIGLVSKSFSSTHGGAERFAATLARELARHGNIVHAVAETASDLPQGINLHIAKIPRKPAFLRVIRFAREARKIVSALPLDIVYGLTQFFPHDIYRMGGGIHRHWLRVRYPFFLWRWINCVINPSHLVQLWLERNIYKPKNYRVIVTNSELCRRHAVTYYQVPDAHIRVIYNGVDHDLFNPNNARRRRIEIRRELGIPEDAIAVLFVATNWQRKGLNVLLRAISKMGESARTIHVIVVGRGRPQPFVRLARKLDLDNRLHFVGATSSVEWYYGAGDLLVLPTLYDPFANVCLEAMACGLPVITSAANGAAEILRPGRNGYTLDDPRDFEGLSHLLNSCLDRQTLTRIGAAARETALQFTLARNVEETLLLCRQVMEGKWE
jgi:UDP-glucose:(heptosyl)LPS alpha-1,3-glucosyltransferase